jgi:hypothetical protein
MRIAKLGPVATAKEFGKLELLLEYEAKENRETKETKQAVTGSNKNNKTKLPPPINPTKTSTVKLPTTGIMSRFTEY